MNSKGQALVEFVIIIPIIMMIIFVIIDFSNVFYQKNNLENITNDVVRLKENGKTNEYIKRSMPKDIKISYKNTNNNLYINVSKDINLVTTERVLLYE